MVTLAAAPRCRPPWALTAVPRSSTSKLTGRVMSRTAAKKAVTLAEHIADTAGVECRKDEGVKDHVTYAFLTTTSNDVVGSIHKEGIPVILTTEGELHTWLNAP